MTTSKEFHDSKMEVIKAAKEFAKTPNSINYHQLKIAMNCHQHLFNLKNEERERKLNEQFNKKD